jgi:hypothetical protein
MACAAASQHLSLAPPESACARRVGEPGHNKAKLGYRVRPQGAPHAKAVHEKVQEKMQSAQQVCARERRRHARARRRRPASCSACWPWPRPTRRSASRRTSTSWTARRTARGRARAPQRAALLTLTLTSAACGPLRRARRAAVPRRSHAAARARRRVTRRRAPRARLRAAR